MSAEAVWHQCIFRVKAQQRFDAPDKVRIVARPGAFEVIMMGEAMRDGGLRDRIPVRNLSSGRVVEAIISGAGEVEIVF